MPLTLKAVCGARAVTPNPLLTLLTAPALEGVMVNVPDALRDLFWTIRGRNQAGECIRVLETHVVRETLPSSLSTTYNLGPDRNWVLNMRRVPSQCRDLFPRLRLDLNAVELDGLPAWQRGMFFGPPTAVAAPAAAKP